MNRNCTHSHTVKKAAQNKTERIKSIALKTYIKNTTIKINWPPNSNKNRYENKASTSTYC